MDAKVRRVGVLELDAFPTGLYEEIAAALPEAEVVDGSDTFAAARAVLDDAEAKLLARADAIASAALPDAGSAADVGDAVGAVERAARRERAEEAYIAIAPDFDADRRFQRLSGAQPLARRFAIRATIAYKGCWVRRIQTFDREDRQAFVRTDAWFDSLTRSMDSTRPLQPQIAAALAKLPAAHLVHWMAESVVGTRPLAVVASSEAPDAPLPPVPALILTLSLTVEGKAWCGARLAAP